MNWRWPGVWSIRLTMPTPVVGGELGELLDQGLGADLGAQVQAVADAQEAGVAEPVDAGGEGAGVLAVAGLAAGDQRADAQGVEDRGDAGAGELGVVGEDRRRLGPDHAGAGLEVALEVVGVELDQAGGEVVAVAVLGPARHAGAGVDRRDQAVAQDAGCRARSRTSSTRRALARISSRDCARRVSCGMAGLLRNSGTTMGDWRRHAIYFAPPRGSALARFGADWLGWDPEARDGARRASPCRACRGRGRR